MKNTILLAACVTCAFAIGCSRKFPTSTPPTTSHSASAIDGSQYLLSNEPEGAENVIAMRTTAKDGDSVVIVGRIGGSENPWIAGRVAFSIVDLSLKACSDIPGDQCEIPWDYCCETHKLPTSLALIKLVDTNGDLVKADARELLKVKELSTVIVNGKAQRDDAGNLTVLASSIYVKN